MAAISWILTSTEQYPAQYGSASMSLLQMPSAARRSASPWCSITAASSPKAATTWGASILSAFTISPMACLRFTPSYSRTVFAIVSVEQLVTTTSPEQSGFSGWCKVVSFHQR